MNTCEQLAELLKKDMSKEDFESLVNYLKQLTHELGNGTLTNYRKKSKECRDMVERMGELNDNLGESK